MHNYLLRFKLSKEKQRFCQLSCTHMFNLFLFASGICYSVVCGFKSRFGSKYTMQKTLKSRHWKVTKSTFIWTAYMLGTRIFFAGSLYGVLQILCSDFENFAFRPFLGWETAKKWRLNWIFGPKVKFPKSLHQICRTPYREPTNKILSA